jgi:tetratricopeptide (TPR) repeat protein
MHQKFCGSCGKQLLADTALGAVQPSGVVSGPAVAEAPVTEAQSLSGGKHPAAGATVLEAYALVSLEVANWQQALAESSNPQGLQAYQSEVMAAIADQIHAAGGQINASKNRVLFASFRRESSPEASLKKAVELSKHLLTQSYRSVAGAFQLRIGLDLELAHARNPLTSTLERSIGEPGTLTVSQRVYERLQTIYPFFPVGPVAVGHRSLTFYRLEIPSAAPSLPEGQPVMEGAHPVGADIPMAAPLASAIQSSTQSVAPEAPVPYSAHPTAPAVPLSEGLPALSTPAPVSLTSAATPVEQPLRHEQAQKDDQAPTHAFPEYNPPVLTVLKSPRSENTTYNQVVEALSADFSSFLSQNPAGLKGKILSLSADDGLGKSSIIHMARAQSDPENQRGIWMGGGNYRCFHPPGLPLLYWLELLQNLLSLVFEGHPSQDVRQALDKFLDYVYEGSPPSDVVAFLQDFLLVRPPQPLGVETRNFMGRIETFFLNFFRIITSKRPLILVFEDLNYADQPSLDLLVKLLEAGLLQLPVYLVLTHPRDYYAQGRLAECFQKSAYHEWVVGRMDSSAMERFLDDGPLGGQLSQWPSQWTSLLTRQAKGLPLYLEEALRLMHLKEALIVDPDTGKFLVNADFNPADLILSDQLAEVVAERLSHLGEQSMYLLQLASILGEKFAVNLLFTLAQMDEDAFNEALTLLFNHGFLIPDATNSGRFRHGILWSVVYEGIEDELREQMHQLISEALEGDFNRGLTVPPALLAHHSQQGRLLNRAITYWNLTGIYCGQVGSLAGLNMALFHALALMSRTEETRTQNGELALRMLESAGVLNMEEDADFAVRMLTWVCEAREKEGDPVKQLEPLGFLASAYENVGNYTQALGTLEKSLSLIDAAAYPLEAASLQMTRMEYLYTLGRLHQARDIMENILEPMAQTQGHGYPDFMEAFMQARLLKAQILLAQCEPSVLSELEAAQQLAASSGQEELGIALRLIMAQVHLRNGHFESCNREADSLLNAIEQMPDSDWFLAQWGLLAIMYHCEQEDWTSASQLVLTVISKAEAAQDYLTWVLSQAYAGYITGRMGKIREGRQLMEQAIGLSSEYRFASVALLGWRFLAEFELSLNNLDVAYEIALKALEVARKPDIQNQYEAIQLSLLCAQALLAKGQAKEAGKVLEPLWPQVVQARWQPLIAACAFEIGQLYKSLAQDMPADLSRKYLTRSVEFFLKAKGIWLDLRHLPQVKKVDQAIPQL